MEDKSIFGKSQPQGISDPLRNFIEALVEEVVKEEKPFDDTKKKWLRKYSENEGLDYEKLEKNLTDFFETVEELKKSDSRLARKLAAIQAESCFLSAEFVEDLAALAKEPADGGLAKVEQNGKYGFIDKSGKLVIPCIYDYAIAFSEGLALVEQNGKWGFVDKSGKLVIPCIYDDADGFSEGLSQVKQNRKCGFIDKSGNLVIPCIYDQAGRFFKQ